MTTSSIAARALLVLAAAALAAGCGNGKSVCGPANDLVPNIIPDDSALDTYWVGSLVLDEVDTVGAGAEHNTLIAANFFDFTDFRVQLAYRIDLPDYPACTVYTSRQVTSGERVPLAVTRVGFSGLAGGEVVLEPDEFGDLSSELLPERGFTDEQVAISVESPDGEADFPAFDDAIQPAPQPVLLAIDRKAVDLKDGPSIGISGDRTEDMSVQWEPAGSDYVEVKIIPGSGSATPWGKLRCITTDDGCLTIPAQLVAYLAADTATNFDFRIEHHFFVLHSIREGELTKAAATIESSSSLVGTVRR